MTTFHYFIFLAVLLVLNVAVLYSYFFYRELNVREEIHNGFVLPVLKHAYLIQAATLLIGMTALFYFTPDKIWFYESKFLYFLSLTLLFGAIGLLSEKSKYLVCLFEISGTVGFMFLLPENIFSAFPLSVPIVRVLAGLAWFIVYKLFCVISDQFEEIILIQSLHIGFSALLVLIFLPVLPVPLLQACGILLPIMFMLTPFSCVLQYTMPINGCLRNVYCLLLTGLAFFTLPTENWSAGILMTSYILFELAVIIFHFISNLFSKDKKPLFFFENLMKKVDLKEPLIRVVVYYNFLTDGLLLFLIYLNLQVQIIILVVLLYTKMYMNIMNPKSTNVGIIDLFKEGKKTAITSIKETSQAISELKKVYAKDADPKEEKGKKTDEQP